MFESKKKQLFSVKKEQKKTTSGTTPAFVQAGMKRQAQTLSGNGALKYSKTDNPFVTQFGKIGEYKKPRSFQEIEKDCEELWAVDQLDTVKMAFYIRLISREANLLMGGKTSIPQRGAELKHEGIMRLIWLANKNKAAFLANLHLLPAVGSWKDIITMLQYDLVYHGWQYKVLPWDGIGGLILAALTDDGQRELIKKYLPKIKANSECTTIESQADNIIGKWICSLLYSSEMEDYKFYRKYRKLKSSGTAHEWQQLISQRKFDRIDFGKIHGRALSLLVRSKFLKNHNLQNKYTEWIKKPTTQDVKYTGFVHELFQDVDQISGKVSKYSHLSSIPEHVRETINKQFDTLVNKGRGADVETSSLIVARDTSGSMSYLADGTTMSSNGIAKALALYFAQFLKGKFADSWIEFSSGAKLHQWSGNTPLERWFNDNSHALGNTDFQSVIQLFCQIKRQGIPESEFPSGILCISDGEFDSTGLSQTNVETARSYLRNAGFSAQYVEDFIIVLWNIPNAYYGAHSGTKFETYSGDARNVFYFSVYSASVVAFLTSKIKSVAELVNAALDQEILNLIQL